jgi:hypothetical protein
MKMPEAASSVPVGQLSQGSPCELREETSVVPLHSSETELLATAIKTRPTHSPVHCILPS